MKDSLSDCCWMLLEALFAASAVPSPSRRRHGLSAEGSAGAFSQRRRRLSGVGVFCTAVFLGDIANYGATPPLQKRGGGGRAGEGRGRGGGGGGGEPATFLIKANAAYLSRSDAVLNSSLRRIR